MVELEERLKAVYAARTYAELEPLTRDLPEVEADLAQPLSRQIEAGGSSATRWCVLSGIHRRREWLVPEHYRGCGDDLRIGDHHAHHRRCRHRSTICSTT